MKKNSNFRVDMSDDISSYIALRGGPKEYAKCVIQTLKSLSKNATCEGVSCLDCPFNYIDNNVEVCAIFCTITPEWHIKNLYYHDRKRLIQEQYQKLVDEGYLTKEELFLKLI